MCVRVGRKTDMTTHAMPKHVHAPRTELRLRGLLGPVVPRTVERTAAAALEQLHELGREGAKVHQQAVCGCGCGRGCLFIHLVSL